MVSMTKLLNKLCVLASSVDSTVEPLKEGFTAAVDSCGVAGREPALGRFALALRASFRRFFEWRF
jgi:hypothetical protein